MATLDDINLFDRYLQTQQLQRDQDQAMSEQFATTPAQATYIASFMAPGSSIPDVAGIYPSFPSSDVDLVDAFSGDPMLSMKENFGEGNYFDATMQGVGLLGDAAYGIPLAGPFIGGGLKTASVLGAIAKANKSKEGIASLPPTLTRNPSKAEIKQNFINQHPPVGSIDSKTGKPVTEQLIKNRANAFEKQLKVPAVRNREELRMSTTKISGVDEPLERIIKTPEDLLGKVLVPVTGDRSRVISGGMDDIRGIPLIQNIPVQGGPNYMIQHAGSGKAWASMEGIANKKQMNMILAADETGLDPYGVYSAMGRESIDFSAPVATAMVAQLPALNIPKKHIKAFNETIRKGIGKTQKGRPDFVGLDSEDVFNQLLGTGGFSREGSGTLRTIVAQEMKKPRWEKLGFPVYDDVLKTINEPSLMDLKTGESGLGIFKANPSKSTFPELQHQSYNTAIPGEYFGGLTASVPPEIMFPKAFSAMSKEINSGGVPFPYSNQVGSLVMNPKLFEVADDEYVDQLIKYMNKNKGTNYAKGGIASLAHLK